MVKLVFQDMVKEFSLVNLKLVWYGMEKAVVQVKMIKSVRDNWKSFLRVNLKAAALVMGKVALWMKIKFSQDKMKASFQVMVIVTGVEMMIKDVLENLK